MTTKHICIFVSYAPSLLNFRGPLIRAMRDLGLQVTTLAPDFTDDVVGELAALGVACETVPLSRRGLNILSDLRSLNALSAILRRIQPDILLTFTIKPNIWGAFAAARTNIRAVANVTGLGYAFSRTNGGLRAGFARTIARILYGHATRRNEIVIFQNSDDLTDFIDAGCLSDSQKARIVNGSGVDMAYFACAPLPAKPVFLMISRLLGDKGVREFAAASIQLKARMPDARCLLVGVKDMGLDAISDDELEMWQKSGIEYLGSQQDVRPALRSCSVYVLPSYREGTPRTVLEAMSMGRPIITTDAPGCRQTTVDGETGYLVPVQNTQRLLEKMEQLAKDPNLRQVMGNAAYQRASALYNVEAVNHAMLQHLSILP